MLKMTEPPRPRKPRPPPHPIVQTLRLERYKRRITAVQLAEMTGYAAKSICEWETGRNNPKIRQLADWAQALGMKLTIEKVEG